MALLAALATPAAGTECARPILPGTPDPVLRTLHTLLPPMSPGQGPGPLLRLHICLASDRLTAGALFWIETDFPGRALPGPALLIPLNRQLPAVSDEPRLLAILRHDMTLPPGPVPALPLTARLHLRGCEAPAGGHCVPVPLGEFHLPAWPEPSGRR